jgi:hypothetical protein
LSSAEATRAKKPEVSMPLDHIKNENGFCALQLDPDEGFIISEF